MSMTEPLGWPGSSTVGAVGAVAAVAGHKTLPMCQAACLKQLVLAVPDLVQVFPRRALAEILMKMINSIPPGQLTVNKLSTLQVLYY